LTTKEKTFNAVRFENVTVKAQELTIIEDVNASVPRGKWTVILGPNGGGKTTLLKCLLDQTAYTGCVNFTQTDGSFKNTIGYVPQRFVYDRDMPITVGEYLASGIQKYPVWLGLKKSVEDKIKAVLEKTGAEELLKRMLGRLSGGEMQRVLLALALLKNPDILVLDEPSAGIDLSGEALFCGLINSLRAELKITVLMVTHDLSLAKAHADNVICLKKTVIAEGTPARTLTNENIHKLFGIHKHEKNDSCTYRGDEK
jgi:zinc transport system ATP-binding protein